MYTIKEQKNIGHHARLKEKGRLFRYQAKLEGKFLSLCTCTRTLRANDPKNLRSRDVQCNNEESP